MCVSLACIHTQSENALARTAYRDSKMTQTNYAIAIVTKLSMHSNTKRAKVLICNVNKYVAEGNKCISKDHRLTITVTIKTFKKTNFIYGFAIDILIS